jgi:hypothetical protein
MRTWGTDGSDKERRGRRNEEEEDDELVSQVQWKQ